MSAGSNNIIIQINDGIAPTIEPKIRGIEQAAIAADTSVVNLTNSLSRMNVNNLNVLAQSLNRVNPAARGATQSSNGFINALGLLVGRAVGAEAGLGMMGGAFARVGVAAGIAGPLVIAGLAVGAVVGAILVYEKFEEAARKLVITQTKLNEQLHKDNDTLLEQKETIAGLVGGPLARYRQEIIDLGDKSITVNITNITQELDDQKSKWATVVAFAERYAILISQSLVFAPQNVAPLQQPFTLQEAEDFIHNEEKKRTASKDSTKGIQQDLVDVGTKLTELHNLEQTLTDRNLANTEVSRKTLQNYYDQLRRDYEEYLGRKQEADIRYANALAEEQLKQFDEEIARYKEQTDRFTIQRELAIRQQQRSGDTTGRDVTGLPLAAKAPFSGDQNKVTKELTKDIGGLTQANVKQNQSLDEAVAKYRATQDAIGQYTIEAKIAAAQEKANLELDARFYGNEGLGKAKEAVDDIVAARIKESETLKAQAQLYAQFDEPLNKYNASLDAINNSLALGEINEDQAAIARRKAGRTLDEATIPLFLYNEGLNDQIKLLGTYGDALEVEQELQRVENQLREEGRQLTDQGRSALRARLADMQTQANVQAELNRLTSENSDLVKHLHENQLALNKAEHDHIISLQQKKIATAQINIALADHNLLVGKGATLESQAVVTFGRYLAGYEGLAKGLADVYAQTFASIADGAANSLGRAIAYNEDLGKAMQDVARTALAELLSGFIKLGLQWVINEAIAKIGITTATTSSAASAAALGAAWAPVAAFVSLATFGANAGPAALAVTGIVALTQALNAASSAIGSAKGFASGGFIGSGPNGVDTIPAWVTRGEFIVNAAATSRHRDTLEAINSGASAVRANSGGGSVAPHISINVSHDGSTGVYVEQVSKDEVRVIAKHEARQAVYQHAPNVFASDISNPNSKTSKAIQSNMQVNRKR